MDGLCRYGQSLQIWTVFAEMYCLCKARLSLQIWTVFAEMDCLCRGERFFADMDCFCREMNGLCRDGRSLLTHLKTTESF